MLGLVADGVNDVPSEGIDLWAFTTDWSTVLRTGTSPSEARDR